MKKFCELLEEISATRAEITRTEAEEKRLTDAICSAPTLLEKLEQKKATEAAFVQCAERVRDLKISVALLKNNAKLALFAEVMPAALEVLAKYKGKPYGEKTREKISEEVKARTGCRFYISRRYSCGEPEFNIYPANLPYGGYDITVGTKYENGQCKPILTDNKIQPVTMEDVVIYYINKRYFEDIPATVREMREAYEKAATLQKELEAACSAFRQYTVEGIPNIDPHKTIYPKILV